MIYGGLPPPPLQTTPRGHLCIPYAKPCQAPPPRPPPRSLATIATSGESESITGCNSSETRPSGKAQPNLVMPTSTPPDICRASRTSYQSSLQHWTEAKRQIRRVVEPINRCNWPCVADFSRVCTSTSICDCHPTTVVSCGTVHSGPVLTSNSSNSNLVETHWFGLVQFFIAIFGGSPTSCKGSFQM